MQNIKEKPVSTAIETGAKKNPHRANKHKVRPTHDNIISKKYKKVNNFVDLFGDIKKILDIKYVLEVYGLTFSSQGMALCPFHKEKTSSFKVYADTDSFYCFGCGAGGSVIDFTMKRFNLTNLEAAERLNADFNLNLLDNSPAKASRESIEKIQQDKKLLADFAEWEKRAYRAVSGYYKALRFWGEQIFIYNRDYFNKYLPEVENIVFVEDLLDTMIENTGDIDKQIEFYETFGKVVESIERKSRACRACAE
jgi:DNA primase